STLIAALRHDKRAREKVIAPTIEADLDAAAREGDADLIVLMLDATRDDFSAEARLFAEWTGAGRRVVVFYNKMDAAQDANAIGATMTPWAGARVALGSARDPESLASNFVPRVMDALKEQRLALARHFPLFRLAVARELINDTSFANASYALGTGFAEIVPALDVPFNVADMIILTKNQALMVYKLGLALGLPTRWQAHVAELGGVVGAGFLWRQIARQLVGLIPVWGIVPKVAVAYAGTYAVGEAILYWYQTGHKMSGRGMRELYADALARGKQIAQEIVTRAPKPSLPQVTLPSLPRPAMPKLPKPRVKNVCPRCGKKNQRDAKYCAHCAAELE
ncbi:MAG: zinc-ribbon domain-containing protein, partial [Chloroflexota bacterium]